ncbi:MAG: hypothetical protein JSV96_13855 [Candidatus Aminicenantes bacterium]|nr:MAG: hypothetical protein JSV96_13855 [Candidatus Aminicenantes bacterium]
MRSFVHHPASKFLFSFLIIFLLFFLGKGLQSSALDYQEAQEQEIEKVRLDRGLYPVISESDLYCSFFILEGEIPTIKILGTDKEEEKILLTDADIVTIDRGRNDGLEIGQIFLILEIGPKVRDFGHLALKRGRARIVYLEERQALAEIEKSCGQVMVGNYLTPFEEKEGLLGKDLGYDVPPEEGEGPKGEVIYLEREFVQIGSNQWAIVDMGEGDGVYVGQQLIIYTKEKDGSIKIIGNCITIDTKEKTSTVKVLSCNDPIRIGHQVQTRLQ